MTTHYLVCYDIKEDDIRFSVADHCNNSGLVRIQYSVFYGIISRSQIQALALQIRESLKGANGDVHIIKVCASCEADHQVIVAGSTTQVSLDIHSHKDIASEYQEEVFFT